MGTSSLARPSYVRGKINVNTVMFKKNHHALHLLLLATHTLKMMRLTLSLMCMACLGMTAHAAEDAHLSPIEQFTSLSAAVDRDYAQAAALGRQWDQESARWDVSLALMADHIAQLEDTIAQQQAELATQQQQITEQRAQLTSYQQTLQHLATIETTLQHSIEQAASQSLWRLHLLDDSSPTISYTSKPLADQNNPEHILAPLRSLLTRLATWEQANRELRHRRAVGTLPDGTSLAVELLVAGTAAAWWRSGDQQGVATIESGNIKLIPLVADQTTEPSIESIQQAFVQHQGLIPATALWLPALVTTTPHQHSPKANKENRIEGKRKRRT